MWAHLDNEEFNMKLLEYDLKKDLNNGERTD